MDTGRKKRIGDRRDGRRLRTLDPYNALTPYIMKLRTDATNYFIDSIELTDIEKYLRKLRADGYPGIGIVHLLIATFVRTASQFPAINRFVSGQRIFARDKVEYVMTVKKEMRTNAPETSVKITLDLTDTIFEVYKKLNIEIAKVKGEGGASTSTDNAAMAFMKLPRLLLRSAIAVITCMDYFGIMPQSIVDASPFHGSLIISDLGSIGIPTIYHHLYNFGNMPIFISIGAKRKAYELQSDGTVILRKYIDYTLVMDERICDGFYFSQAFKLFKHLLRFPHLLNLPPEKVIEDID